MSTENTAPHHSLAGHFLIAMPNMTDPNFANALVYLCEHNTEGAMGLVVNHPLDMQLREFFGQYGHTDETSIDDKPLMYGGPMQQERGFILHPDTEQTWDSTLKVKQGVCLTVSKDIVLDLANGDAPQSAQVILGYAGWGPGQLESELAGNSWLTCVADNHIIFDTPVEQRLETAAKKLGVNLALLSTQAGHA